MKSPRPRKRAKALVSLTGGPPGPWLVKTAGPMGFITLDHDAARLQQAAWIGMLTRFGEACARARLRTAARRLRSCADAGMVGGVEAAANVVARMARKPVR